MTILTEERIKNKINDHFNIIETFDSFSKDDINFTRINNIVETEDNYSVSVTHTYGNRPLDKNGFNIEAPINKVCFDDLVFTLDKDTLNIINISQSDKTQELPLKESESLDLDEER